MSLYNSFLYVNVSVFGVILVRIFPEFPAFSPNSGKYGKNADQNNSEYGHFLHSVRLVTGAHLTSYALVPLLFFL